MKYPQTTAKTIAANCKAIGDFACLAFCYIYCAGIDSENELEYIKIVNRAIDAGLLEKDCTVKDAAKFIEWLTGRKCTVIKKAVSDISEI